ncbi:hypothetical protein BH09PAT1_BH09PAT1_7480 [soil metagenome]
MAIRGVSKKYETRENQLEIPEETVSELREVIEALPWTRAKSYDETFPHEYGQKRKLNNDAELLRKFLVLATSTKEYGYTLKHPILGKYTYLDLDGYSYWVGWQDPSYHDWINRAKKDA